MAETPDSNAGDSAEKAYAAAAETVTAKSDPVASVEDVPVAFPPKARRKGKSVVSVKAEVQPEIVIQAAKPAKQAAKAVKKPVAKKVMAKKAIPAKTKPVTTATVQKTSVPPKIPTIAQLKDKIMATTKTTDFAAGFKDVIADVQTKAKEAFEKSSSAFGDANDFAKGNVEAFVESGKILATGLQDMGTSLAAESRSAFETMTADVKELAAVKSPADFFKLQGEIARRNFDTAVANSSKHSEAMLKLATDVFAPLSGRVSVAVEKARKAA